MYDTTAHLKAVDHTHKNQWWRCWATLTGVMMNTAFRAEPASNYGLDDWRVVFIRADHKRIKKHVAHSSWSYEFTRSQCGHKTSLSLYKGLVWFGFFSIGQLFVSQIILIFNICNATYIWLHAIQVSTDKLSTSRAFYCSVPLFTAWHGCKYLWQVVYCYLVSYLEGT